MSDTRIPMPILTAMHPGNPHGLRFVEGAGGEQGAGGEGEQGQEQAKTFTQHDMDELAKKVRAEERRKATERYADYDDLKAKAEGAKTDAERIAALEQEIATSKAEALRARYAADVPERLRPLLTGTTEEELQKQRDLLVESESGRKKRNNHVPNEGNNPRPADSDDRQLVRQLFGRA